MPDPTNPNENWQQVPNTPGDPAAPHVPPAAAGYPPPDPAYVPPPNYPPTGAGYPPPQAGYPPTGTPPGYALQAEGLSPSAAAAIAYLTFIPAIIFLVMEPYKRMPLVRFHAMQSLALNVVAFAVGIVFSILTIGLLAMGMWTVLHLLILVVRLGLFIAWLIAIIQAAQGKFFKLPILGDFALRQAQK